MTVHHIMIYVENKDEDWGNTERNVLIFKKMWITERKKNETKILCTGFDCPDFLIHEIIFLFSALFTMPYDKVWTVTLLVYVLNSNMGCIETNYQFLYNI